MKFFDVNMKGGDWNETALNAAATYGHLDLVKFLLDEGADVNLLSDHGDSALLGATYRCLTDIAMLLISHGADANFYNPKSGSSPLLHATECADLPLAKALILPKSRVYNVTTQLDSLKSTTFSTIAVVFSAGMACWLAIAHGGMAIVVMLSSVQAEPQLLV